MKAIKYKLAQLGCSSRRFNEINLLFLRQ